MNAPAPPVPEIWDLLARCNVAWDTASQDSSGSMPLGNGDLGINLWVEEDGDLLFYLGKTDAWSGNTRLLKVGRVRVKLTPNPFAKGQPFRQTLNLREGEAEIAAGSGGAATRLRVWVDAHHPVIRVEVESAAPLTVEASTELWRTARREIGRGATAAGELHSAYGIAEGPDPVVEEPDTVVEGPADRVIWCHRNETSHWPESLRVQGLASLIPTGTDPLLHRTFGAAIFGEGLRRVSPTALRSKEARRHVVSVAVLTQQTPTLQGWLDALEALVLDLAGVDLARALVNHRSWWEAFWSRSWIFASGHEQAELVTRGYTLQRYLNACSGRGAFPIKFNGSIFTVDAREKKETFDADYRRWGGGYWFQNTRLPYWSMLAAGDLDLMDALWRMYRNLLPLAEARTRLYFGHEGAFFPETLLFWGVYATDNYGWKRDNKPISRVDNPYIRWYWQGGIELVAMMLERYAMAPDAAFAREFLLPLADAVVTFFDQHYSRAADGKVRFAPAAALETWQTAVDPLPEIAGLRVVLEGLLALPEALTQAEQRRCWQRLQGELPDLPMGENEGRRHLLPARIFMDLRNMENAELYAIFPYRLFGLGKPDLDVGRATFERRQFKETGGWQQNVIQAALLGLTDMAREFLVQNASNAHPGSRFPAFWGPNFDWIPDQDNGGVLMIAVQSMLLQPHGRALRLLPAWPREWDVRFKLHALGGTTIEGVYQNGQLEALNLTPQVRHEDVILPAPEDQPLPQRVTRG